jgi:uncharacterized protein YdeI (YjbR/CyaY-like superfamily)
MKAAPVSGSSVEAKLFANQRAWDTWLRKNHQNSDGLWLLLAKRGGDRTSVTYGDALESALCFGWIDGKKMALDDSFWLQRFTPRSSRSVWSKINRTKALALIAQGRMQSAGLKEIERAKADGRWEAAYDSPSAATVPSDLQAALDSNLAAKTFFAMLDGANRYAVLWRIQTAKRAETRAKRIATYIEMLVRREKLHP